MAVREIIAPDVEDGYETHPAFGMIQVNRMTSTPGAVLFDSDIRHGHTVVIRVETSSRKRDLNRDWIYGEKRLVEIEMSEAQWASFVSSMGTSGVPCTLRARETDPQIPGLPFQPRLTQSMDEVKGAADRAFSKIKAAMAAYDSLDPKAGIKERREALNKIRAEIRNAAPNVGFAAEALVEHAENVVQRSRADIEAMAVQAAQHLGLSGDTPLVQIED